MTSEPEIPYELQNAVKKDCLVVFAGSGTSIRLGLPTWKDLVLEILGKLKLHNPQYEPFSELVNNGILSPLEVLDYFNENKAENFKTLIFDVLHEKLQIPVQHDYPLQKKILQLTNKIITTNYDRAFEAANPHLKVIQNDGFYELAQIADRKEFLFKIHGDINTMDKCILFECDYKNLYTESAFLLGLKILFIQKTILFIGFSLNDLYIQKIIKTLNDFYKLFNRTHFIVTTDGTFNGVEFNNKIRPINIGNFSNLDNFLDRLISMKSPVSQTDVSDKWTDIKNHAYSNLIGRKKELEEVMAKIRLPRSVTVIYGLPGVGKTSLATEIVRVCKGFSSYKIENVIKFDFYVYVSLNNLGLDVLDSILDKIGRETEFENVTKIEDKEQKQKEVDDKMKRRPVLLMIDNFEMEHDKKLDKWIQNVEPPSEVLVISLERPSFPHNPFQLNGLSEPDALEFISTVAENRRVDLGIFKSNANLKTIISTTNGNPQLMNIIVGLIKQNALRVEDLNMIKPDFEIFHKLYDKSWSRLSDHSKKILSLFPLFAPYYTNDRNALIEITELGRKEFDEAICQLDSWNLLHIEQGRQDEYTIHPSLNNFLRSKNLHVFDDILVKESIIQYYLKLVKESIVREMPDEVYWNSLVSDKMKSLQKHWGLVLQAMQIASEIPSQKRNFLEFVLLLIHYMDSRFYNQERLEFAQKAIEVCRELNEKYIEALLKIDALGWTYIEEYNLSAANKSITEGQEIIKKSLSGSQADDLNSLAWTWLSRVKLGESFELQNSRKVKFRDTSKFREAQQYIDKALRYSGKPWIQCRVYMADGDIKFEDENYDEALKSFLNARSQSDIYGVEGFNYQLNPRIGFAYLGNNEIEKAREIFTSLSENYEIVMGKLYGDYGLAIIEYKEGKLPEASKRLNDLEEEIGARSSSHLLLRLIQKFKEIHTQDENGEGGIEAELIS